MATLSKEHRKLLENTVAAARTVAVTGARKTLLALRVGEKEAPSDSHQKELRSKLRAHGRQLGDRRQADGTQETLRLEQACAYEHWHRMLFARFLAENALLINPEFGVPMSLTEVQETARELKCDWLTLASDYAQQMLLEVFRPDDPVLHIALPQETRQQLEELLALLPVEIFQADDSLGWVYQFWQRDEKDRVNKTEVKIGPDELSPVTQLFTEDYMVLFMLHNTLGAWWIAKRRAEGKKCDLPGVEWTHLRLNDDGSPAAGDFDGWPRFARELRILDPCMGSGHFLTFALPIVTRMRQEEEGLSLEAAVHSVLQDNLYGLELDARCSQIAAFNLALKAWRMIGLPTKLPSMNLACSGVGIHAGEQSWLALAGESRNVRFSLAQSYKLFQKAPTLGSLIDPTRDRRAFIEFDQVWPLLEAALSEEHADDESRELAIAARGVLAAARMLSMQFTLVATNVPYLGRGKHTSDLAQYCETFHSDAKADLATCFVERCLHFCSPGGSAVLVTPQNWLFLTSYERFRKKLFRESQWDFVARLGEHAFESTAAAGAFVVLLGLTRRFPDSNHFFVGLDASAEPNSNGKNGFLTSGILTRIQQCSQLKNPDARLILDESADHALLSSHSESFLGLGTGDFPHYGRMFWELPEISVGWTFHQCSVESTTLWGGRECIVAWDEGRQRVKGMSAAEQDQIHNQDQSGQQAWGKPGVAVGLARELRSTIYTGEKFDKSVAVLVPKDPAMLPALWAFAADPEFNRLVRRLDQKVIAANGTLVKVPFDAERWKLAAVQDYPDGIPAPSTREADQWLFDGHPMSANKVLQVAVARLAGYLWPRQTGSTFWNCPGLPEDGLEVHADADGIVCLSSLSGESSAADRLRALLADAFGQEWSATKLAKLIGDSDTLETWLRDRFFVEHSEVFHQRPFIWHVWDGRKDGFHALVNYHKLAGPNGEGRKTLEKLIYTSLGDWIRRQEDEVKSGTDGAEGRLLAAQHLKAELVNILHGEAPYDLFVRWKPFHQQPIGWEPDINDGIRLNMRPWLHAKPYQQPNQKLKQGACILRVTPIKLPLGKDRGKEPLRDKGDFPWYATSQDRTNDLHFSNKEKLEAREKRQKGTAAL